MKTIILIANLIFLCLSYGQTKSATVSARITTQRNNYYQFVPIDKNNFRINWGNDSVQNVSTVVYPSIYNDRQSLVWDNADFIVVKGWTGSDSWQYVVLPLNKTGNDFVIYNPVGKNEELNIVVTEYGCRKDTLLKVIDLFSKNVYPIIDQSIKCSSALTHYCIDSIEVLKNEIVVRWILPNKVDKPNRIVTKHYSYNAG